jgi:hypothetical protein
VAGIDKIRQFPSHSRKSNATIALIRVTNGGEFDKGKGSERTAGEGETEIKLRRG